MIGYAPIIVGVTIIALIALIAVLARQGHAEDSAGHRARLEDPSDDSVLRAPGSRPGGPGQAGQAVIGPGQVAPADPEGRSQR